MVNPGINQRNKGMREEHQCIPLERPAWYEIQVQGRIAQGWISYFDEMQMVVEGEDGWAVTTLTGCLQDQAALQGLLQKLYNLGLVLLKVARLETEQKEN
jgi:hypothetical protein